jgi:hypothetical protein
MFMTFRPKGLDDMLSGLLARQGQTMPPLGRIKDAVTWEGCEDVVTYTDVRVFGLADALAVHRVGRKDRFARLRKPPE